MFALAAAVIEDDDVLFAEVADYRDANFLPAATKYGDESGLSNLPGGLDFIIGDTLTSSASAGMKWLLKVTGKKR